MAADNASTLAHQPSREDIDDVDWDDLRSYVGSTFSNPQTGTRFTVQAIENWGDEDDPYPVALIEYEDGATWNTVAVDLESRFNRID